MILSQWSGDWDLHAGRGGSRSESDVLFPWISHVTARSRFLPLLLCQHSTQAYPIHSKQVWAAKLLENDFFFFLVELGLCVYCLTTEWAQSECQQSRGARRADGCQDHGNATLDNFSLLWNGRPGEVPTPPNLKLEVGIQRQCTFFSHCNNKQFDPEPLRVFPQLPKSVQIHDDKLVLSPKSLYFILKFLV